MQGNSSRRTKCRADREQVNALARLLRPFGIKPRTLWPPQRTGGSRSARGYFRADFEAVLSAYCYGTDTPSQLRLLQAVK
jgi:hypothetical protein